MRQRSTGFGHLYHSLYAVDTVVRLYLLSSGRMHRWLSLSVDRETETLLL